VKVALTYDDGPSAWTWNLLRAFHETSHRATFFVLGGAVRYESEVVKRLAADGHEIGAHGWTHTPFTHLSADDAWSELLRTRTVINQVTDRRVDHWRAPHHARTERDERLALELGMTYVGTNNDPGDWYLTDEYEIYGRVMKEIKEGSIINLHDSVPPKPSETCRAKWDVGATVRATRLLLKEFDNRGIRSVTVSDL